MTHTQLETLDASSSTMTLSLDIDLYPRDVVYGAAYVFLDRAYVLLDRAGARILVHLRGKQPLDEATLRAMAGEFENELLAQALRHKVFQANRNIIEQITALAISGAVHTRDAPGGAAGAEWDGAEDGDGSAQTAAPAAVDDGKDFLDDPLGIAVPWEPKTKDD